MREIRLGGLSSDEEPLLPLVRLTPPSSFLDSQLRGMRGAEKWQEGLARFLKVEG